MGTTRDARPAARALVLGGTLAVLAACSGDGGGDTPPGGARATAQGVPADAPAVAAAGGATGAQPPPSVPPAHDADQRFLRHMADHYEHMRALAHAGMSSGAGHAEHGGAADPAAFDAELDAEQSRVLDLLGSTYGEPYSPRAERVEANHATGPVTPAAPVRAATGHGAGPGAGADAGHGAMINMGSSAETLSAAMQDGVVVIDRALPTLRRPAVRALAVQLRAAHVARAARAQPRSPTRAGGH